MTFRKANDDDDEFMNHSRACETSLDKASQKNTLKKFVQYHKESNSPKFQDYKNIFKKYGLEYRKNIIIFIYLFSIKVNVNLSYRNWKQMNFKLKNYVVFYFINKYESEFYDFICTYFGDRLQNPKQFFDELKGTKTENKESNDFIHFNEKKLFDDDYMSLDENDIYVNTDIDFDMASFQIDVIASYIEDKSKLKNLTFTLLNAMYALIKKKERR